MAHHHFTREDRVLLAKLKTAGLTNISCARILGFHPSSIGRELKRGSAATTTGYDVRVARERAAYVRTEANQQHRKLREAEAERLVGLLRQYYSPDQAGAAVGLSHATVYRWLWACRKRCWQVFGSTCVTQN
jgi:IS30 family transposase